MPKIVIGLFSCVEHSDRDAMCRDTWIPHATAAGVDVVFLHGGAESFERVGDILRFPVEPDYNFLPKRTRAFAQWFLEETDADYAFKADNDTYIVPKRLIEYPLEGLHYVGCEPGGKFRGYCSGGAGYFLSRHAAGILAEHLTRPYGAEDKEVGRILKDANVRPKFDKRFVPWGHPSPGRHPTPSNNVITAHKMSVELWFSVHQSTY